MSELSYLEKLLDGVEVKWLPLGNVAEIYGGLTGKSKSDFENGNARYVSYKKIFGYLDVNDYPTDYVYISEGERQNKVRYGDVLFTGSSEIADEAGMSSAVTVHFDESVYLNSFSFGIRFSNSIKIKPEFAKYLFRTHFMRSEIAKTASGVTRFNISKSRFKKILVPIICPNDPEKSLAIQSEIVRILDKFTALTAELTAELNMRKKQYNYYRDQLLNLEGRENTREMRIGDIYDFQYGTGNTIPKSGGQYPVYGSNGIVGSHDKYNSEDSPVIGHIGAYAGIVNWGQGKHFVTYNGVICRHKSKEVLQKYAYYLLLLQDFGSKSNSASQPFVSYNILNAPIVLVPPLQEQARIVAILDKFDTLTNSITEGLPREIELRQKQYEYYRDLLFSFPKPETVSN
ncbi:restriction endonuclease subunit S [Escherichia coli]|uniref:restriction endonuclease subunit S n=2 Tax=Escherichia coli TaxID=562 RepID=UPI001F37D95D|nr:restriction endonuclease subunit S [Escherichia coli]MCF1235798.1 restriction endonuclease subunit S [Escherichia coli]